MPRIEKSVRLKLWIIFGLFMGLICGLIAYEVSVYLDAKKQRENFEAIRRFESKQIQKQYKEDADAPATENAKPEDQPANDKPEESQPE